MNCLYHLNNNLLYLLLLDFTLVFANVKLKRNQITISLMLLLALIACLELRLTGALQTNVWPCVCVCLCNTLHNTYSRYHMKYLQVTDNMNRSYLLLISPRHVRVYVHTVICKYTHTYVHTHKRSKRLGNVLERNNNLDLPTDRPELLIVNEICNQKWICQHYNLQIHTNACIYNCVCMCVHIFM